ncbi:HNH endonuclease signature motif containing protein [Arthrobacter polaris]|uniref:HNH endonuclease signature motif containing protein n=1 Tax=Arthrobacter polaris TaxID=2813727 RepID=UPI001F2F4CAB|nr:HNH endonuclease signature motif containing protein [Arthrobacter polaris]UIK88589.1 HNH endonuclease [Arthrobacter polaris]
MLRIRDEYCQFPGCTAKASTAEIDHLTSFNSGGPTIFSNLHTLCKHHHLIKHFTDDKTRNGAYRINQSPERREVKLRGWTPHMTTTGIAWTSPTGKYHPPTPHDGQPPVYPQWIRKIINHKLHQQHPDPDAT